MFYLTITAGIVLTTHGRDHVFTQHDTTHWKACVQFLLFGGATQPLVFLHADGQCTEPFTQGLAASTLEMQSVASEVVTKV